MLKRTPIAAAILACLAWPAAAVEYTWTSGNFVPGTTAPQPLATADVLNILGGATKTFSGVAFSNNGSVIWHAGGGTISVGSGAVITNNGLWDAQGDQTMSYPGGGAASFVNNGTLRKSGGAGVTLLSGSGLGFTNNGTVDAQTGILRLSGGPMAINAGSVFTGAGVVEITTATTFNGAFTSGNLVLANGVHTGNNAVLNGNVVWRDGSLAGTWQVGGGQSLQLTSGATKVIGGAGTVLTNGGTVTWAAGGGTISMGSGAVVVNNGVWDAQGDGTISHAGGGATGWVNNGRFQKSGGNGTTSLSSGSLGFSNPGVVDVQVGTIALPAAFVNTGTLMGDGSFSSSGGITNEGTVAAGSFGVGTLRLAGNYTQTAAGMLAVDLSVLGSVDLLSITGNATLDGVLALRCVEACSFAVGDSFTILDASGTLTGSFAGLSYTGFSSGAFDVLYDMPNASVRLVVTEAVTAVPEPGAWAMLLAGLGAMGFIARRRRPGLRSATQQG